VRVPVPGEPDRDPRVLVDGGVFANNPTNCALSEAVSRDVHAGHDRLALPQGADDYLVVSVGTGVREESFTHVQADDWGLVGWRKHGRMLDVAFDGQADAVDYHLDHLLPGKNDPEGSYFRFRIDLTGESIGSLDDASEDHVRALKRAG
jgi:hypothetical protein